MDACLCIFGYPGFGNYVWNKDGTIREGYQRGLEKKALKSIKNNVLCYEISTLPGQSGCPVIAG
jgi:V8-like Glu-specific endopeptidase